MYKFFGYVLTMTIFAVICAGGIALLTYTMAGLLAGATVVAGMVSPVVWPVNLSLTFVSQLAAVMAYLFGIGGLIVGFFVERDC